MSIANTLDFFIQWHLTERCNLRCRHCYQTDRKSEEISFPEIKDILEEISDTIDTWKDIYGIDFSASFNVTGGEPFFRQDILTILSEIKTRGFSVYLLTNGILIDEKKARALSVIGVDGIQVSMEGPEKVHESIRGKGSFSASLKGVKKLLDNGLKVTLNVTLSSMNAGYFMDMIELSQKTGVQRLGFSRLVPSGRGEAMVREMLSAEKVKGLYGKIFSLDTGPLEIVTGDPVASQIGAVSKEDCGDTPSGGCAAGVSGLTILPDGTLTPCRRLHIPIGNIRKQSLREIWAMSGVLEALRDRKRYKGRCGRCRRWAECRGCRAIAYAFSRTQGEDDFLSEDPQCFIE